MKGLESLSLSLSLGGGNIILIGGKKEGYCSGLQHNPVTPDIHRNNNNNTIKY